MRLVLRMVGSLFAGLAGLGRKPRNSRKRRGKFSTVDDVWFFGHHTVRRLADEKMVKKMKVRTNPLLKN